MENAPNFGTKEFNDLCLSFFGGKLEKEMEETAENYAKESLFKIEEKRAFIDGFKECSHRMYTEEELNLAFETGRNFQLTGENNFKELLEQFKKDRNETL